MAVQNLGHAIDWDVALVGEFGRAHVQSASFFGAVFAGVDGCAGHDRLSCVGRWSSVISTLLGPVALSAGCQGGGRIRWNPLRSKIRFCANDRGSCQDSRSSDFQEGTLGTKTERHAGRKTQDPGALKTSGNVGGLEVNADDYPGRSGAVGDPISPSLNPGATGVDQPGIGSRGRHSGVAVVDASLGFIQRGEQRAGRRCSAEFLVMIAEGSYLPLGPSGVFGQRALAVAR